jgi:hypothetical protein
VQRKDEEGEHQKTFSTEHQWLTPVILATQEAVTMRIEPRQIVCDTLSRKKIHHTHTKKGLVEWLSV